MLLDSPKKHQRIKKRLNIFANSAHVLLQPNNDLSASLPIGVKYYTWIKMSVHWCLMCDMVSHGGSNNRKLRRPIWWNYLFKHIQFAPNTLTEIQTEFYTKHTDYESTVVNIIRNSDIERIQRCMFRNEMNVAILFLALTANAFLQVFFLEYY